MTETKDKVKKLSIFDYYKNIIKKDPMFSKEEVQSSFDIIGINRLFSYDKMNVLLANEINTFVLDKWTVYLYYYYGVDKKPKVPFLKMRKEKDEEKERMMELAHFIFPEYSEQKLADTVAIMKKFLSQTTLDELNATGGLQKKEKKHDKDQQVDE